MRVYWELIREFFTDFSGEVADSAIGANHFLDFGAMGEGLFTHFSGLKLQFFRDIKAFHDDIVIADWVAIWCEIFE